MSGTEISSVQTAISQAITMAKRKAAVDLYEEHLKLYGLDTGPVPTFSEWMAAELRAARKNMADQFAQGHDDLKAGGGIPSAAQSLAAELRRATVLLMQRYVESHKVQFLVELGDSALDAEAIDTRFPALVEKLQALPGWMQPDGHGTDAPVFLCAWEFNDEHPDKLVISIQRAGEIPHVSCTELSVKKLLAEMPAILAQVFGEGATVVAAGFDKKYGSLEQGNYLLDENVEEHA